MQNESHKEPLDKRRRIGIIGCGRISARHLQVIAALPELQLVAVCDPIADRVERAAKTSGAKPYSDFLEMVQKENLDIAVVLTESGSHARIGAEVAPHVKALIVEKPMSLTLEDADRLIETCDANQTRLFVVKQNRYNSPVVRLRSAFEKGRFGKLVLGSVRVRWSRDDSYYKQDAWRGTWRDDGGVLANQASHHLDLLQWMMGSVESVMAYTATRLAKIETEDTAVAVLRFTSGALGVIEATTATRPKDLEGSLSILGENGTVVVGGFAVNKMETWNFTERLPEDDDVFSSSVSPPNVYGFGHYAYYRDILECLKTGRRAMLDGLEGRKSLELVNAIYESATNNSEVRLHYVPRGVKLGRG
jgi:UDP-N-acetyl-2-amino-2-deoxyglucuronate dehydrogenase